MAAQRPHGSTIVSASAGVVLLLLAACTGSGSSSSPAGAAGGAGTTAPSSAPYALYESTGLVPLIPDGPPTFSASVPATGDLRGTQYNVAFDQALVLIKVGNGPACPPPPKTGTMTPCERVELPRATDAQLYDTEQPCQEKGCGSAAPAVTDQRRAISWRDGPALVTMTVDRHAVPSKDALVDLARRLRPPTQTEWRSIILHGATTGGDPIPPLLVPGHATAIVSVEGLGGDVGAQRNFWLLQVDVPGAGRFWVREGFHQDAPLVGQTFENQTEPTTVRGVTGVFVRRYSKTPALVDAVVWHAPDASYCVTPMVTLPPGTDPASLGPSNLPGWQAQPRQTLLDIAEGLRPATEDEMFAMLSARRDEQKPEYGVAC
jgi:hypothetical protein